MRRLRLGILGAAVLGLAITESPSLVNASTSTTSGAVTNTSFDEFRAAHNAEHQTAFNRWCVAVGNAVIILSAVPLLLRRWRDGTAAFLVGGAITGVGHVAEGNLPRA